MNHFEDTICAPATAVGGGAVSVIRVSGPEALRLTDAVVRFRSGTALSSKGYALKYGTVQDVDEVLVGIFRAPRSYTGEDSVEISCHASRYIVEKILQLLVAAGCRMAEPGEFTRRAFVNGKMDLSQAEAVADLIASGSEASHKVALSQLKGAYSSELKQLREELLNIASLLELELDFSEEEVELADRAHLKDLLDKVTGHVVNLVESFRTGNAIKNGVPVAIAGAVNAGKSTLLNALVGEDRAIVSDIPGTTRDTIEETVTLGGILFRFIDTAGLRESTDAIEKKGIERSYSSIDKAQIILGVLDGCAAPEDVKNTADMIASHVAGTGKKLILLRNKADICDTSVPKDPAILGISAKTGEGLDALKTSLVDAAGFSDWNGRTLVTNLRHYEALQRALESLRQVSAGLERNSPTDLLAQDLRDAISELGSVFGTVTSNEVLENIFSKFCIGK